MTTQNYFDPILSSDVVSAARLNLAYGQLDQQITTSQNHALAQGRLTLVSGDPLATNVTGASMLYFTPYRGNQIALYDGGSDWALYTFSEMSESLSGLSASTVHDVFAYTSSGTVALEFLAWTNDTTRATGLAWQDCQLSE